MPDNKVTLGGDRLGSGNDMQVELKQYSKSNHDLGYVWRSSMAAGTLVPFLCEVALPEDTFHINLDADILTHPTVGPLFGSYKVQLDVFQAPIRLYNALLHNNKLGIGLNMNQVLLPFIELTAKALDPDMPLDMFNNYQIEPSSILSYLNIRGVGANDTSFDVQRRFNAVPLLAYWEIYKNYYANKQEKNGAMIFTPPTPIPEDVTSFTVTGHTGPLPADITYGSQIVIVTSTGTLNPDTITLETTEGNLLLSSIADQRTPTTFNIFKVPIGWSTTLTGWRYTKRWELPNNEPEVTMFPLEDIDTMRELILQWAQETPFNVNVSATVPSMAPVNPYRAITEVIANETPYNYTQQCLALKTYQSDLFNNWLDSSSIDNINQATAISVSQDITIDQINIAKKVYDLLNSIAVTGGSYNDWLKAVYNAERIRSAESPIYCGGLIKELVFQEVTSTAATTDTPLGTQAGKGRLTQKNKGGRIEINVDEPSYIIGIISLTPRIDYSQGNKWDTSLGSLDDLHKPALDQLGFQDLITEQMAWFGTYFENYPGQEGWKTRSAGKQPSWVNYMTNVNQVRGNFAKRNNEMFMTLNRDYEPNPSERYDIKDLTTYIDPKKFNHIFAETARDAQNFWAQVAISMHVRRKMSAKQIPSL